MQQPFLTLTRWLVGVAVTSFAPILGQGNSWVAVGSTGQNDWANRFVLSPNYAVDGHVWLVPHAVGAPIWLSTDHGDTFTAISSVPAGEEVWGLAVSPTFAQDRTLFLSTAVFAGLPAMHKSTDGGVTWTRLPQTSPLVYFAHIELSPSYASDQLVVATSVDTRGGAMRSTDGGQTWAYMNFSSGSQTSTPFDDIEFAADFATSRRMVSARSRYLYAFGRSDDAGLLWGNCREYGGVVPCAVIDAPEGVEIAPIDHTAERGVFFFGSSTLSPNNILRSDDLGIHWQVVGAGLQGRVFEVQAAADYMRSGRVYAATNFGVFVSDDKGATFQALAAAGLAPGEVRRLTLGGGAGGDLYALTGPTHPNPGQLYRLRLSGTGFTDLGGELAGGSGAPALRGTSPFARPQQIELRVSRAAVNAPAALVLGFRRIDLRFLGGTLVPNPDFVLPFLTDRNGEATSSLAWPVGLPRGSVVMVQDWVLDPGAVQGVAATTALALTRL